MKYAFNSFVLEANIPVAIQGNDSLYTFQNITNSSITVLGSNNGTDWVSLCVVNAANAKTTHSAFKFLCINSGTLLVNRAAAGSSATTALVDESGTEVSSSNPLPVQNVSASPVDRSGTITTGGVAQIAAAALSARKAYFFCNLSSESMWGSFTGTAAPDTVGSFEILPRGSIRSTSVCETTALSIYGATTGKKYTMWEM